MSVFSRIMAYRPSVEIVSRTMVLAIVVALLMVPVALIFGYQSPEEKQRQKQRSALPQRFEVLAPNCPFPNDSFLVRQQMLLIKDHNTGKEYLGIHGIGFVELGPTTELEKR